MNLDIDKEVEKFQQEVNRLRTAVAHIDASKAAAENAVKAAQKMESALSTYGKALFKLIAQYAKELDQPIGEYKALADNVTSLSQQIQSVDFPQRLEQIENSLFGVTKPLETIETRLEKAIGQLQQAANGLNRIPHEVRTSLNDLQLDVTKPIKTIEAQVKNTLELINNAAEGLNNLPQTILEPLNDLQHVLRELSKSIAQTANALSGQGQALSQQTKRLEDIHKDILSIRKLILEEQGAQRKDQKSIKEAIEHLLTSVKGIVPIQKALQKDLSTIKQAQDDHLQGLNTQSNELKKAMSQGFNTQSNELSQGFNTQSNELKKAKNMHAVIIVLGLLNFVLLLWLALS